MEACAFCPNPVDPTDEETFHETAAWVSGPKKDGAVLRDYTGRVAHKTCVDIKMSGQAPDQPTLFDA